jgi:hypothetical protein
VESGVIVPNLCRERGVGEIVQYLESVYIWINPGRLRVSHLSDDEVDEGVAKVLKMPREVFDSRVYSRSLPVVLRESEGWEQILLELQHR